MSILTSELSGRHKAETTAELWLRIPVELAKVALPSTVNEASDATFLEAEDALTRLNVEADQMIHEKGKASRKVRKSLTRYAHRLLELTSEEPDLLDPRSISLVAHASDASGDRELLKETLDQAHRAEMSSDTDFNLQVIEAALETDKSFTEIMTTLNATLIPFSEEPVIDHIPLSSDYDYLFDASIDKHAAANRDMSNYDDDFNVTQKAERPLFAEQPHRTKVL